MNANIKNRDEFCKRWIFNYGGTLQNAIRVWQMECLENLKYDLSLPFPSDEELYKAGIIERDE